MCTVIITHYLISTVLANNGISVPLCWRGTICRNLRPNAPQWKDRASAAGQLWAGARPAPRAILRLLHSPPGPAAAPKTCVLRLEKKKGFLLRRPVAWVKSFPAPLVSLRLDSLLQHECILELDYITKIFRAVRFSHLW